MSPEDTARKYARRPGYRLVSYAEVALPFYRLTLQAVVQVRKQIRPLEEFVLRSIRAGLTDSGQVAGLLGMPISVIEDTMTTLIQNGDIDLLPLPGTVAQVYQLTVKGRQVCELTTRQAPEERSLSILYDGLLREPVFVEDRLAEPRQVREWEMLEIPPHPAKPPSIDDLSVDRVAPVLSRVWRYENPSDLLALKEVLKRNRLFKPSVMLVYKLADRAEVDVWFAIDGRVSTDHSDAFMRSGAVHRMGIENGVLEETAEDLVRDTLGAEFDEVLSDAERQQDSVLAAEAELADAEDDLQNAKPEEAPAAEERVRCAGADLVRAATTRDALPVRIVDVHEHASLLMEAIQSCSTRLMIISPWIRAQVVDDQFVRQLELAAKRGVQMHVGYGFGDDNRQERDRRAEDALAALSSRFPNFVLYRLGDSHAKVLICDNWLVMTSFNWLSFRGDPKRTFRDERGMLLRDAATAEDEHRRWLSRFPA